MGVKHRYTRAQLWKGGEKNKRPYLGPKYPIRRLEREKAPSKIEKGTFEIQKARSWIQKATFDIGKAPSVIQKARSEVEKGAFEIQKAPSDWKTSIIFIPGWKN